MDVAIEIHAIIKPARVFAEEPTRDRIEIPGAHVVETRFRVELPARELEWIGERTGGGGLFSE